MPDNDAAAGMGLPGSGYGDVLWEPSPEVVKRARITGYRRWLAERGVSVGGTAAAGGSPAAGTSPAAAAARDYRQLWQWSVGEPAAFWGSLWDYFGVLGERGDGPVLAGGPMPDASWFPGATLNYARNALRTALTDPARTAVIAAGEDGQPAMLTYGELAAEVARVR
ncbi:MAG TPA: acetyl-coenzyme A synthetase N-terminal domain-containing protein, partial [Streptosporangiaceae bacterium]|nr:acetyl-coenzyme A synthetase N-terminal domain-containing protein [Streptosporangiaceae bacterium]